VKKIFRAKPVLIEAMQITEDSFNEVCEWIGDDVHDRDDTDFIVRIKTYEGIMVGGLTDWIIKGTVDEFYPCIDEVFQQKYEEVDMEKEGEIHTVKMTTYQCKFDDEVN